MDLLKSIYVAFLDFLSFSVSSVFFDFDSDLLSKKNTLEILCWCNGGSRYITYSYTEHYTVLVISNFGIRFGLLVINNFGIRFCARTMMSKLCKALIKGSVMGEVDTLLTVAQNITQCSCSGTLKFVSSARD